MSSFRDSGFSIRFLLLHPVVWFLVATCMLIFLATMLWDRHHERLVDHGKFSLSRELVQVNKPPVWLEKPAANAVDEFVSLEKSLLDVDMVPEAKRFVSSLPWVREIRQIEKSSSGLRMELTYRTPIALVDPIKGKSIPVDGAGVVFDASLLRQNELSRFETELMRINMPWLDTASALPWHQFSDKRVQHGAQLVEYVNSQAASLGLFRVVTYDRPTRLANEVPQWEIWTRNRTRVFWGSAPGLESNRESSARGKLAAIEQFIAKFGQLESFDKKDSLKIDVSTGTAVLIRAVQIAELENWSNTIK